MIIIEGHQPLNGQEIAEHLHEAWEKEINNGLLYPNLNKLREQDLLNKNNNPTGQGHHYTTTPRGTREIEAYLDWVTLTRLASD